MVQGLGFRVWGWKPVYPREHRLHVRVHQLLLDGDAPRLRFRGGLVFKAHRLCVSLNSRLESDTEEKRRWGADLDGNGRRGLAARGAEHREVEDR